MSRGCLLDRLIRLIERACEATAYVRKASNGCSAGDGKGQVRHTVEIGMQKVRRRGAMINRKNWNKVKTSIKGSTMMMCTYGDLPKGC